MAFYKCLPFKKEKVAIIENNQLLSGYTRTASYLGASNTANGVKFSPNPNGTWATIVCASVIPAKCKKVKVTAWASLGNCGYVGVTRDPNAKGPGQCIAGFYINRTSSGTTAIDEIDISAFNEPLYFVASGYYEFSVKTAIAE